jgi:hypothetical protein
VYVRHQHVVMSSNALQPVATLRTALFHRAAEQAAQPSRQSSPCTDSPSAPWQPLWAGVGPDVATQDHATAQ